MEMPSISELPHRWTCSKNTLHCKIPHHLQFLSKNGPLPLLVASTLLPWTVMGISPAQKKMGKHRASWMPKTEASPWHLPYSIPNPVRYVHKAHDNMAHSVPILPRSKVCLLGHAAWSFAGDPAGGKVWDQQRECGCCGTATLSLLRQTNSHLYILLSAVFSALLSHMNPYSGFIVTRFLSL